MDSGLVGAAWVYTRNDGVWTQQGSSWSALARWESSFQGLSVALSADGNTADGRGRITTTATSGRLGSTPAVAACGPSKGRKLVGRCRGWEVRTKVSPSRCPPTATLPWSAACATMALRGSGRSGSILRSGGVWLQQGAKLVGTGAHWSCTAGSFRRAVRRRQHRPWWAGSPGRRSTVGAAWVYTRSNGASGSSEGSKLVGTGLLENALTRYLCRAVRRRQDRAGRCKSTAGVGAAWVYTLSPKGEVDAARIETARNWRYRNVLPQGYSVALSADGNTAIVGGRDR